MGTPSCGDLDIGSDVDDPLYKAIGSDPSKTNAHIKVPQTKPKFRSNIIYLSFSRLCSFLSLLCSIISNIYFVYFEFYGRHRKQVRSVSRSYSDTNYTIPTAGFKHGDDLL